jgi:hypothetical protein
MFDLGNLEILFVDSQLPLHPTARATRWVGV